LVALIDTNVIIRFLVGDHEAHLAQSTQIFEKIETGQQEVEILSTVIMEVLFVLTKFYKLPKQSVVTDLKSILALKGVKKLLIMISSGELEKAGMGLTLGLSAAKKGISVTYVIGAKALNSAKLSGKQNLFLA
jgi:predicted nucleic acid-binding protein